MRGATAGVGSPGRGGRVVAGAAAGAGNAGGVVLAGGTGGVGGCCAIAADADITIATRTGNTFMTLLLTRRNSCLLRRCADAASRHAVQWPDESIRHRRGFRSSATARFARVRARDPR